ncbi:Fic family protein, partial [Ruminococcaceae bacterium OttesenSCG-928-A11]|nr:Fic family protein [Ruminococcaceae bacterium OttesenSCG-928-A11]
TPRIVNLLTSIHEYRGKQASYANLKTDVLGKMVELARVQSTKASNRIEGIVTTDKRLEEIVNEKSEPRNRSEQEIAGYREVLATIHDNYEYITLRPNVILQLHRDLYVYSGASIGGQWKTSDNIIQEVDADGNKRVRFDPVPAFETAPAMDTLCSEYLTVLGKGEIDPLLLMARFILDFLCIHPFNDGNGRMSRLLTLLMLYKSGFDVGRYISIEMIIENTKDSYYDTLQASSAKWHEMENDYVPFVEYYLGTVKKAYLEFSERAELLSTKGVTKTEQVRMTFENHLGKLTKKEILEKNPGISESTVETALRQLVKDGVIQKIGGGRYTSYILAVQ